jgi:hypothetical protein
MAQKTKDGRTASHFISVQALAFLSFPILYTSHILKSLSGCVIQKIVVVGWNKNTEKKGWKKRIIHMDRKKR